MILKGLNNYKKSKILDAVNKLASWKQGSGKTVIIWGNIQIKAEMDYLNVGEIKLSSWAIYDDP